MIIASSVTPQAHDYIAGRLKDLADAQGVRILFAIESGSRAWGFPSADSDYDVRFVYTRRKADYLSVIEHRDVIETPTLDDQVLGVPLDLNGWDIRKALRLGLKSNPVLREWLTSPIRYDGDDDSATAIDNLVSRVADRAQFLYHYDRLARSAWTQMADETEVKVKRYCYALRPALMLRWLDTRSDLPPMDAASLCSGLDLNGETLDAMATLFAAKRTAGEHDLMPRRPFLDDLIAQVLEEKAMRPEYQSMDPIAVSEADALMLKLLGT